MKFISVCFLCKHKKLSDIYFVTIFTLKTVVNLIQTRKKVLRFSEPEPKPRRKTPSARPYSTPRFVCQLVPILLFQLFLRFWAHCFCQNAPVTFTITAQHNSVFSYVWPTVQFSLKCVSQNPVLSEHVSHNPVFSKCFSDNLVFSKYVPLNPVFLMCVTLSSFFF